MKTILYTNEDTRSSMWQCEGHVYVSGSDDEYETMLAVHQMVRESDDASIVESVRFLIKTNGIKFKDN